MTNKERLLSFLGFAPADINALDGALIDFGVDGTLPYATANTVLLKKAAIQMMETLLTTADTNTENGSGFIFGTKYDRGAVQARIKLLKGEIGLIDESLPFIKSRPVW